MCWSVIVRPLGYEFFPPAAHYRLHPMMAHPHLFFVSHCLVVVLNKFRFVAVSLELIAYH